MGLTEDTRIVLIEKNSALYKQKAIKRECYQMYEQIKTAQERLETLRKECKHPNTFQGNYSWRPGNISLAEICSDCGELIKYV